MPINEHFESNAESLNRVFDRAQSTPFNIPRFQRGYTWSKEEGNFDDFWEDLKSDDMRFFGTMLFNITPNHDGSIDVVDGQQRLTTATIFVALVRNLIHNYVLLLDAKDPVKGALKTYASEIEKKYIKDKRTNTNTGQQDEILYLIHNKPKIMQFFKKYIQDFDNQHKILEKDWKKGSEQGRIKECYKEFKTCIETDSDFITAKENGGQGLLKYFGLFFTSQNLPDDPESRLNRFDRFKTVEIEISDDSLAYEYFDAVNARGVQLSIADLLKNLILKNVSQDMMPDAESKWNEMIEKINSITLSGCDVDQFFRYYWAAKQEYIPGKGLYRAIKKHTSRPNQDWILFLTEIVTFGEIYYNLCMGSNADFRNQISNQRNRRKFFEALRGLRAMKGARTWIVLLMNILEENKYVEKGILIYNIAPILEKFIFNYFTVLSLKGNSIFQLMHSYCKEFNALIKDDSSSDDFIALRNKLYKELKSNLHPVREDYVEKAIQKLKYDTSPLMRYVFSEIEEFCLSGPNTGWNEERVSIEHIIPQKPHRCWKFAQSDIKKTNLDMIGNLSLLEETLNGRADNLAFKDKLPFYSQSNFKLIKGSVNNDDLCVSEKWDFKHTGKSNVNKLISVIEERSKHIVDKYIYTHFYENWKDSF